MVSHSQAALTCLKPPLAASQHGACGFLLNELNEQQRRRRMFRHRSRRALKIYRANRQHRWKEKMTCFLREKEKWSEGKSEVRGRKKRGEKAEEGEDGLLLLSALW